MRELAFAHRLCQATLVVTTLLASTPALAQEDQESSAAALNVYSDAASFQNNGEYELAADEWDTFLKKFPGDPLAIKARYYAGVCRRNLKQLDQALVHFEAALAKNAKFELAEDAYLNCGWCQWQLGINGKPDLLPKAATTFTKLIGEYPKTKYIDQALFYLAESQYEQGKTAEAATAYRRLVDEHEESAHREDGMYYLGVAYQELEEFQQAGAVFDRFIADYAESRLLNEVRMRKAETVLQAGDYAAAEKMLADVLKVEGFAMADHALSRQAFSVAKQERHADAAQLYAKLVTAYPESPYAAESTIEAGRYFFTAKAWQDAETWLTKSVTGDPANAPEAAHWLCLLHIKAREPAKALAIAERVLPTAAEHKFFVDLKIDQADALYAIPERREESLAKYLAIVEAHADHRLAPQSLYYAAFTAQDLGKYDAAFEHAGTFLKQHADHALVPDTKHVVADCQQLTGDFAAAEATLRDLVQSYTEHSARNTWRIALGSVLAKQDKHEDAVAWLKPLATDLKKPEQIAEVQLIAGQSHFALEQHEEAATVLTASLAASSDWKRADEVMLTLSRAQRGLNQLDEARATVAKVIADYESSPLLDQAHYRAGEFAYAAGDHAAAVTAYDVVIKTYPESAFVPYSLYGKGWSQIRAEKYPDGITAFTALIVQFADHSLRADAHLGRAMCRRQTGEHALAIEDADEVLKGDPADPLKSHARYERGMSQIALKQFEPAVETFLALARDNADYENGSSVLYELGWAYMNIDDRGRAISVFTKLSKDHPDTQYGKEASVHVGEDQYAKKDYAAADASFTAALDATNPAVAERARHKLGWTHFRQQKYDASAKVFDEQLKAHPTGALLADGLFMKGESLFQQDKFEEALAAFTAAREKPSADEQKHVLTLVHGGRSASELKRYGDAIPWLDEVATKFPESPYLPEAVCERGWAKQQSNQLDESLADYEKAVELSRGAVGARAQFLIGQVHFAKKEYDTAIRAFKRVMFGFGGQNAAADVKNWQALAGFECGRCSFVRIKGESNPQAKAKLIADAKLSFTYVVQQHPNHARAESAKENLATLARL